MSARVLNVNYVLTDTYIHTYIYIYICKIKSRTLFCSPPEVTVYEVQMCTTSTATLLYTILLKKWLLLPALHKLPLRTHTTFAHYLEQYVEQSL